MIEITFAGTDTSQKALDLVCTEKLYVLVYKGFGDFAHVSRYEQDGGRYPTGADGFESLGFEGVEDFLDAVEL